MSNNREIRVLSESVHMFMGLKRVRFEPNSKKQCIRQVIKDYDLDLKILESKLLIMGGEWRIHRTVNARDCEKARKILLHTLIDHPEKSSCIDTEWRTALLQRECIFGEKKFMLDVDTQEREKIVDLEIYLDKEQQKMMPNEQPIVIDRIKSPKGWHYITNPFDTRLVCNLDYVTLQRDGYVYVKTVGKVEEPVPLTPLKNHSIEEGSNFCETHQKKCFTVGKSEECPSARVPNDVVNLENWY